MSLVDDTLRHCESRLNINRMLFFSAALGASTAISSMGVFDCYLFNLTDSSNSAVGIAESISGISQVLVAAPAGLAVDRYSRSRILTVCCVFSFVASIVSVLGVLADKIWLILASLFLNGVYYSVQNTATYSLFSDSVPQGKRAKALANVAIVTQTSMAIGPLLAVGLFWFYGDEWNMEIMHIVLVVGFLLLIPANLLLLGWQDVSPADSLRELLLPDEVRVDNPVGSRLVPYLVCLNDVVTCIGAGMTVKFFPLFFKNEYSFSPIQLQSLFACYLLTFGVFTFLCERLSREIGRVPASLLFSAAGVGCLMALAKVQNVFLVIVIFILRGAFQNSIYPIDRSLIMDFVPSDQRGRWNAFESVSSLTWSGSAALGGYLMDTYDYRTTFQITAIIYMLAFALRLPLLYKVPREERFK